MTRSGLAARARRGLRGYPGQFWLLFGATFAYLASSALVFPYFGIYLTEEVGVSRTMAGVILGVSSLVGLPLQVLGGSWADRRGRRGVMLFSVAGTAVVGLLLAASTAAWQAEVLVLVNGAVGWPLFLTASNAMIADIVDQERATEAYGIARIALNAGVVVGPAIAGFVLDAGVTFTWLFAASGTGCAVLFVVVLTRLEETQSGRAGGGEVPVRGLEAAAPGPPPAAGVAPLVRSGYGLILRDRTFMLFCLVSLLPLFCYGQIVSTYPVYITQFLDVARSRWGLLLSLNAALVVIFQYPLVRSLQSKDPLRLIALATAFLGIGIGGAAFAFDGWPLWLLMVVFSVGEILFVPLSTSMVSGMTTVAERGRYMGIWTLFWIGGQALSPLVTGWTMDTIGGRAAIVVVLAAGAAGAVLYPLVCRERRAA